MKVTLTSTAMKSDTTSLKVGPQVNFVERTLYNDTASFNLNLFQGNLMFSFEDAQVYVWKMKNW